MNYSNAELIERLAGEYVLGTMRSGARRRFEGILAGNIPLRRAVQRWEQRLFALSMQLPAVQPPAHVWTLIERRINPAQRSAPMATAPSWLWQAVAASVATIAVALGVLLATREPEVRVQVQVEKQPVAAEHTAIIADASAPVWVLNAYPDANELRVQALRTLPLADNQVFELWMLPDSGAAPVSLGLLPRNGSAVLRLSAEQLRTLVATSKIAVSIEPAGGSPTGAPTGAIPYAAPLLHIAAQA